jgi:Domain of unknown function (DUF4157)/Phosphatidylinositol 3- and 4-kinase
MEENFMERQHLSQTKNAIAQRAGRHIASNNRESAIARSSTHPIEELQGAIGNRAVNKLLANQPIVQAKPMFRGLSHELVIQPKLTIGAVGDKYEQEADRISQQVVSQINAPESSAIQRKQMPEEDEQLQMKPTVQRLGEGNPLAAAPELEASIQQAKSGGQPLPEQIRQPMEQALGSDFSGVKVHADAQSHQLNQSIQAKAFTTGKNIFFRHGEYNPESRGGKKLLAHELTHVMQQSGVQLNDTVQRLPDRNTVEQEVGSDTTNQKYQEFLNTLDGYTLQVSATVDKLPSSIDIQVGLIEYAINKVIQAANKYLKQSSHTSQRALRVQSIKEQAGIEMAIIRTRATYFKNNPKVKRPTWKKVIPKELGTRLIDLGKGTKVGPDQKGAINTVGSYQFPDTYEGFYKADKKTITNLTEKNIAEDLGIPETNPNFSKRAVAVYRIDRLLNANVIAQTDYAHKPSVFGKKQDITGSFMKKASGETYGFMANNGKVVKTADDKVNLPIDTISGDDQVFQRCLSKLNMVDALAFQVDRHAGNFLVQTDGVGNVKRLTGIDNDLSFPKADKPLHKDVTQQYGEYSGISWYFDKKTAEMVLALNDNDLKAVLTGLLTDEEINLTVERLHSLQAKLNTAKANNQLLGRRQWNAMTAKKEQQKSHGYINSFNWKL